MLLDKARLVSMKWFYSLKSRATDSTDDKQRNDFYSRASEITLLCINTFDVDDEFVDVVL